ncbi:MAG: hypothetical protein IKJ27_01435 [Clostridia bacterium]|nr:hypothetical protein [Clostridia bacterium]
MKKLLSVILAVLMIAASIPMALVPASAAEEGYNGVPLYPELITEENYETFGLKDKTYVGFYAIRNASELYGFNEMYKENFGKYNDANVVLLNDIVVNTDMSNPEYTWSADIFNYYGNFDGNGCTISGLYCVDDTKNAAGLFGSLGGVAYDGDSYVKNLTIANSRFSSDYSVGALAGGLYGQGYTISNCLIASDVVIETAAPFAGGMFGIIDSDFRYYFTRMNLIENCVMAGKVKSSRSNYGIGAFGGYARHDGRQFVEAKNCYYVEGNIISGSSTVRNYGFGGKSVDYITNKGCTKIANLNAAHTCINVTRVATDPTCSYEGVSSYTHCIFCGKKEGTDTSTAAHGKHVMGDYVYNNDGTCYENGTKTKKCIYHCGKAETVEAPDTITHGKMKTVYKTEATCKNAGHSTYEECTVCGYKVGYIAFDQLECNFEKYETVPATCTRSGMITYRCTLCKELKYEEIPALGHDLVMQDGKAPTCKEEGYSSHAYCTRCDYKTEEYTVFDNVWHDYSVPVETKEPTCTGSGYTRYKCKWCDSTEIRDRKPYLSHDYKWTLNEEYSHCGQKPYYDGVCEDCGYATYKFEGDVIEHDFVYDRTEEPTCYKVGLDYYRCTKCSREIYEVIPMLEHKFDILSSADVAGCTEGGSELYRCSNGCGDYKRVYIEPLGHDIVVTQAVEATCITDGWTAGEKCSRCDYVVTSQKIPATGHTYDEENGKVISEPTCLPGLTEYSCSECGDTLLKEIAATGEHELETKTVTEATCKEREKTETTCKNCEYYVVTTGDYADEHKEIKVRPGVEATCTSYGYTDETYCAYCGVVTKQRESIPIGDHKEEIIPEVPATCTMGGYTSGVKCSHCGTIIDRPAPVDPMGHEMIEIEPIKLPTCNETGHAAVYKCKNCDYVSPKIEFTDLSDHTYDTELIRPSDCSNHPLYRGVCKVCSHTIEYEDTRFGNDGTSHNFGDKIGALPYEYVSETQCGVRCNSCNKMEYTVNHSLLFDADTVYSHKGTYGNYTYYATGKCGLCYQTVTLQIDKGEIRGNYQECDHICHKTGFMGFFAKIAMFFWKLFKTNPVCECGMAHY